MPRIVPKVEGRGNGIKTVLVNVADIATSLNRDASEITKFFGCELGAQTTMSVEDDRYVVNGAHSTHDLQNFMAKYIECFVLCKNCRLPETHYKIKGGIINQKCMACGSKDPCDMTHKLTTFILKQVPNTHMNPSVYIRHVFYIYIYSTRRVKKRVKVIPKRKRTKSHHGTLPTKLRKCPERARQKIASPVRQRRRNPKQRRRRRKLWRRRWGGRTWRKILKVKLSVGPTPCHLLFMCMYIYI